MGPLLPSCFSEEGGTAECVLWTEGLSGAVSLQCVPALVMYPDCGPVWHRQYSVYASPSHVPRLVLSGIDNIQYMPTLVMYPDCDPVWHRQ